MKTLLSSIFIYMVVSSSTCKKNCISNAYSFSVNIIATPDLDSINVNDTIWLELDAFSLLTDTYSGSTVDFSNASNLSTVIQVARFTGGDISNPGGIYAEDEFEFIIIKGTSVQNNYPGVIAEVKPLEANGSYILKCGIIPKNRAIYGLAISNAANVYRKGECAKAGFQITFANTNQHLYLYEQNRPGYIPSEYEQTHMYCFKVK